MLAMNKRVILILLLAILALATFFRFWRLDNLPPGLYHDEAYNGLDALALNRGELFPQFYEGWELYAAEAHDGQPLQETRFPIFFEGNYGREPCLSHGPISLLIRCISFCRSRRSCCCRGLGGLDDIPGGACSFKWSIAAGFRLPGSFARCIDDGHFVSGRSF